MITATFTMENVAGVAQPVVDSLLALAQAAIDAWSAVLAGNATTNVTITIGDTVSGRAQGGNETMASLGTYLGNSVFEPGAAYELRSGQELGQAGADIHISISPDYLLNELYLDPTPRTAGDIPNDRTDGLSVLMHEIGHGLGFIGYYNEAAGAFDFNANTPYDTRVALINGAVYHVGPNTSAVYGRSVPLTDNNYTHYGNTRADPNISTDPLTGLMNGVVYYRGHRYAISSLDLAILADSGIGTIQNDIFDLSYMHAYNGGAGSDTVTFSSAAAGVTVSLAIAGEQNVGTLGSYTLVAIENLTGSAFGDSLTGSAGANRLVGSNGDDRIEGRAGDDMLDGGAGADTVSYAHAAGGVTVNLAVTTAQNTLGDGLDRLTGFESVIGSALADTLTGTAGANRLDGARGADDLRGGLGNDVYVVDNAGDKVFESANAGIDTVESSITFSLAGRQVEKLTLTGATAINATGNAFANLLIGNNAANRLDGGIGADDMRGGLGNDVYVVDTAGDKVIESANAGIDTIESAITLSLAGRQVENLTLTGATAINATGNTFANLLIGNNAANRLDGGIGADDMRGGLGNDVYVVDTAGDKVIESANAGVDTVESSITFSLAGLQVEKLSLTGTAAINATGNGSANALYGNRGANTLNGSTGDDDLHGGLGKDILIGGAGRDSFWFDTAPSGSANFDTISDFVPADDTIKLAHSVFGAIATGTLSATAFHDGATAQDASDRIIYNSATGDIFYDADGTGASAAVLFAHLAAGTAITNADFLIA